MWRFWVDITFAKWFHLVSTMYFLWVWVGDKKIMMIFVIFQTWLSAGELIHLMQPDSQRETISRNSKWLFLHLNTSWMEDILFKERPIPHVRKFLSSLIADQINQHRIVSLGSVSINLLHSFVQITVQTSLLCYFFDELLCLDWKKKQKYILFKYYM